jgi:acyl phosphate:glycerol-3-phosphate acyltransferase
MIELGIKISIAYLLGSINGSMLLGNTLKKTDIRSIGSGNAGATNAYRSFGPLYGLSVFFIDIAKGIVTVVIIAPAFTSGLPEGTPIILVQYLCGLAALIGHIFPIWYDYRGGKGVATAVGIVAAVHPILGVIAIALWTIILLITRYVCIASTLTPFLLIMASFYLRGSLSHYAWLLAISFLILFMHRANFKRLHKGTESKI